MHKITQYTGLLTSILTLVLGIIDICRSDAKLQWPDKFLDQDINLPWRELFGVHPDVLATNFTPLIMGCIGIILHMNNVSCSLVASSYLRYFIFLLLNALFACFGYLGGLGIIVGSLSLVAALLSLITFFIDDGTVGLQIRKPFA